MTRRCKFTTPLIPLVNHVSYGSKCIVVNGISGKKLWTLVACEQALVFVFRDGFRVNVHVRRGGGEDRNGGGEEGRESQGETLPQGAFLFVNYSSYPGRL